MIAHDRVVRAIELMLVGLASAPDLDQVEWVNEVQGRDLVRRYLAEGGELSAHHAEILAELDEVFELYATPAWRAIRDSGYDLSDPHAYWHRLRAIAEDADAHSLRDGEGAGGEA
jgi:hypothetical protein